MSLSTASSEFDIAHIVEKKSAAGLCSQEAIESREGAPTAARVTTRRVSPTVDSE